MKASKSAKAAARKAILAAALVAASLLVAFPFAWMILSSFKRIDEFYVFPPRLLPKAFILDNFRSLLVQADFGRYYLNSISVTLIQVLANLCIVTLAGYGFAKYDFRGKKFLFSLVMATTMVPWVATIIPLFILANKANLVDSYLGLVLPGCADAFSIFLARNFICSIPTELVHAARIDGAGELHIFRRIVLPLVKPLLSVITINKFIGSWNAFQWPLLVVGRDELRTIPLAVAKLSTQYNDAYDLKMAAATLSIIPVLAVYAAFQRNFVSGISLTGVKG